LILREQGGGKLSKRKGDPTFEDLLAKGFLPAAAINYIACLGWTPAGDTANQEIFTLNELEKAFEIKHISKSPTKMDMAKLAWMNGEHIKRLPPDEFYTMALPSMQLAVKTEYVNLREIAAMVQPRIQFLHDIVGLVDFIDALPDYDITLFNHKKMKTDTAVSLAALEAVLPVFDKEETWDDPQRLYALALECAALHGWKNSQILWPVRTALSGKETTPCGATELCVLLGKNEGIKRIQTGIRKLREGLARNE
jgi:glutamyl-tRNA synthetase